MAAEIEYYHPAVTTPREVIAALEGAAEMIEQYRDAMKDADVCSAAEMRALFKDFEEGGMDVDDLLGELASKVLQAPTAAKEDK